MSELPDDWNEEEQKLACRTLFRINHGKEISDHERQRYCELLADPESLVVQMQRSIVSSRWKHVDTNDDLVSPESGYRHQRLNPHCPTIAHKEQIIGRKLCRLPGGGYDISEEESDQIFEVIMNELDAEDDWVDENEKEHDSCNT